VAVTNASSSGTKGGERAPAHVQFITSISASLFLFLLLLLMLENLQCFQQFLEVYLPLTLKGTISSSSSSCSGGGGCFLVRSHRGILTA
jgi:hypothetical protein